MNSLEIQYFLTIVKYGSFTESRSDSFCQPARHQQADPPAGGRAGLQPAYARSGRTLSLTEAGQAYYAYFQQCRFQLDLLKNRLEEPKKDGKPTIRIAYPEDVDPVVISVIKSRTAAAALENTGPAGIFVLPGGQN